MIVSIGKRELFAIGMVLAVLPALYFVLWRGQENAAVSGKAPAEEKIKERTVVIIDAGHGGFDGGAVSPDGVAEAEINLAVAKDLALVLAFLGENTALTRQEDISLDTGSGSTVRQRKVEDLKQRTAFVEQFPQGVLLSIHQNSLPSVPSVHGAQAFFNPAGEGLGQCIQQELNAVINDREKQARAMDPSVYLLSHTRHPSVLIECGFLSNGAETERLQSPEYQRRLALTIAAGYLRWQEEDHAGQDDLLLHGVRQ